MNAEQEKMLREVNDRTIRIEARLVGDKLAGTPSLIDDVDSLKKKVTVQGFFKMLLGLKI